MSRIADYARQASFRPLVEGLLILRALCFVGTKHTCPCCGWRLRAFTHGGTSFRTRHHGYCPRCNAKARHRRNWLFLADKTNLFTDDLRLFHVSPKYSLSRYFKTMSNINYMAIDIQKRANICAEMDLTALAIPANSMDAAICIHVLEHIEDDRAAIAELHRIMKPGGWAIISVPIRLDQPTYEDASIVTPEARREAFGESGHFRFYGHDLVDRLEAVGFQVDLDLATNIDQETLKRYGLLADENIFYCTKV